MEILSSRTGEPTAVIGGIALHSRYDPVLEAERFVGSGLPADPPAVVLLLGGDLGHLPRALRRRLPAARVLGLYYDRELRERSLECPEPCWDPGLPETPEAWLRRHLCELDLEGLALLEWPAAARIWPEAARRVRRAVEQVLRELRGSLVTTRAAGRRWLRNSLLNFRFTPFLAPPPAVEARPIVLAASGPSLERARPWLRRERRRFRLWALPSSALFLKEEGLNPDLVVLTDPSWYALYHLHALADRPLRIAMPLPAAAGCWRLRVEVTWISQGTFFERELLGGAGVDAPLVPSHGTVTATALDLALALSTGPVILAGLDLCTADIRTHARPNPFERFLEPAGGRLAPLHGRLFSRAVEEAPERRTAAGGVWRTGLPLETYAGWFAGLRHPGRVRRLHPSPVDLPGLPAIGEAELATLLSSTPASPAGGPDPHPTRLPGPSPAERRRIAGRVLRGWEARLLHGLREAERGRGVRVLSGDPFLLDFAYFLQAGALIEVKRVHRLQGEGAAAGPAGRLLEDGAAFVRGLIRELEGSGGDFHPGG